jgi:hypothetical protein
MHVKHGKDSAPGELGEAWRNLPKIAYFLMHLKHGQARGQLSQQLGAE